MANEFNTVEEALTTLQTVGSSFYRTMKIVKMKGTWSPWLIGSARNGLPNVKGSQRFNVRTVDNRTGSRIRLHEDG